jgi:predicted phage terminase large subunit-like protein
VRFFDTSPLSSGFSRVTNFLADICTPLEEEVALEMERCEDDLRSFIESGWHVLEPANPFTGGWHIDAICEFLTAITDAQIRNGVINIPPRHMKSLAVSVFWPTWEWLKQPSLRYMFGAYRQSLAKRDNGKALQLIESPWFQKRWAHRIQIRKDVRSKTKFENTLTGYRIATSVTGGVTGDGADRIVADDPHNVKQAESLAVRESTIDWWDGAMSTRGNNPKTVAKLVIMQRVHERDVAGSCIDSGDYETLILPAEFDGKRRSFSVGTGKYFPGTEVGAPRRSETLAEVMKEMEAEGKRLDGRTGEIRELRFYDPRTQEGELLWEPRFDRVELEKLKKTLGPYRAAGQLAQEPAPPEGGRLKRVWWRFWQYQDMNLPPVVVKVPMGKPVQHPVYTLPRTYEQGLAGLFDETVESWDMAFTGTENSSFTVGQVWGRLQANRFLLDQHREQNDIVETIAAFRALTTKWPFAITKLIENKANGPAVCQTLKNEIPGIVLVPPYGDKDARAVAVSPYVYAGNVYLPHPEMPGCEWVPGLINEGARYPLSTYGDQVDTLAIALLYFEDGIVYSESELDI